eukprot:scaffold246_cov242-Pinguiococcus_pyrenoidosus.AAC.2
MSLSASISEEITFVSWFGGERLNDPWLILGTTSTLTRLNVWHRNITTSVAVPRPPSPRGPTQCANPLAETQDDEEQENRTEDGDDNVQVAVLALHPNLLRVPRLRPQPRRGSVHIDVHLVEQTHVQLRLVLDLVRLVAQAVHSPPNVLNHLVLSHAAE